MTVTVAVHPLAQTFAALGVVSEEYRSMLLTEPDAQPGWLLSAGFAAEGTPHLVEGLRAVAAHYKTTDKQAPAALWFGRYAFAVAAVPIATYLAARRVPSLAPREVWVRQGAEGDIAALAWRGRSFAALADDPEAAHPDCVALPTVDALRDHLRDELIAHFTPMIDAVRARSSLGKPGLWAIAADSCASAFTWLAEEIKGDAALGAAEALAFAAAPSRLHRKRGYIYIEHCGLSYHLVDRLSCCLYYRAEDGQYCSSCPHRPPEERVERIKTWLAQRAAQSAEAVGVE